MKKYQQLLLLILSIISLVSLLIYRHEYNKLRYVLEVLNFFGTPGITTSSNSCSSHNVTRRNQNLRLSEPLPSWQRISNNLFIYSAFWETVEDKSQVKAIALESLSENMNYDCYLWFEDFDEPVKGQFSFSTIKYQKPSARNRPVKRSKIKAYMFYCKPLEDYSTPFGVTFHKISDDDNLPFIPVLNVYENRPISNTTAFCVLPVESLEISKSSVLEFISYHHVLGISHFIFYGGRYFHSILTPLLKSSEYNVDVTVLQWNYPFSGDIDVIKSIVEADCLLRTKGRFDSVLVLHWNQYVVPRFHTNINTLITYLDSSKKLAKFQLFPYLFCLEYKDDPEADHALPLALRKTRYTIPKAELPVIIHHPHVKMPANIPIAKVDKQIVAVNWYTKCSQFDLTIPEKNKLHKYDKTILQFNSDFLRSKILKSPTYFQK